MARIRTIKPEFWTDESLTECSLAARLLFIGTWNFADDNGNLEASPRQLKLKIFPADDIDVVPLLVELLTHGVLTEYSVSGKAYFHIKGFRTHQVINRPSPAKCPLYNDSVRTHGALTEYSLREGKGKELDTILSTGVDDLPSEAIQEPPQAAATREKVEMVPYEAIATAYAEHCPSLPKIRGLTAKRKREMKSRWQQHRSLEVFVETFSKAEASDFLTGRDGKWAGASFDWLLNEANMQKVLEGNYDTKGRGACRKDNPMSYL